VIGLGGLGGLLGCHTLLGSVGFLVGNFVGDLVGVSVGGLTGALVGDSTQGDKGD